MRFNDFDHLQAPLTRSSGDRQDVQRRGRLLVGKPYLFPDMNEVDPIVLQESDALRWGKCYCSPVYPEFYVNLQLFQWRAVARPARVLQREGRGAPSPSTLGLLHEVARQAGKRRADCSYDDRCDDYPDQRYYRQKEADGADVRVWLRLYSLQQRQDFEYDPDDPSDNGDYREPDAQHGKNDRCRCTGRPYAVLLLLGRIVRRRCCVRVVLLLLGRIVRWRRCLRVILLLLGAAESSSGGCGAAGAGDCGAA